jgi:hypothetical protein
MFASCEWYQGLSVLVAVTLDADGFVGDEQLDYQKSISVPISTMLEREATYYDYSAS